MKREHSYILGMAAIVCFALIGCTKTYNYYVTETKKCTGVDSGVYKAALAESAKARKGLYWVVRQRDQLKIDKHELEGRIPDTNVFPIMRFTDEGKLIK